MAYVDGTNYRAVVGFKDGKPIYQNTKIRTISGAADGPQTLFLENGDRVELVGPWPKSGS